MGTVTIFTILDLMGTVKIFTILVAWHRNHSWFGNPYFSVVGLVFASDFQVDSDVRVDNEKAESRYTRPVGRGVRRVQMHTPLEQEKK